MSELGSNLIAELVASLIFIFAGCLITVFAMKSTLIRKLLRKLGVNIKLSHPQLDFDMEYDTDTHTTRVIIKNAGDQVAFNVYCFLFEVFHASESGNFKISSLGAEKIRAGALAPGEKVRFEGKQIRFESCGVTAEQELWVEYTDETGQHYRTRIIPPSPRGDDLKVEPPIIIYKRIPRIPDLSYNGEAINDSIRNGQAGLQGLDYK